MPRQWGLRLWKLAWFAQSAPILPYPGSIPCTCSLIMSITESASISRLTPWSDLTLTHFRLLRLQFYRNPMHGFWSWKNQQLKTLECTTIQIVKGFSAWIPQPKRILLRDWKAISTNNLFFQNHYTASFQSSQKIFSKSRMQFHGPEKNSSSSQFFIIKWGMLQHRTHSWNSASLHNTHHIFLKFCKVCTTHTTYSWNFVKSAQHTGRSLLYQKACVHNTWTISNCPQQQQQQHRPFHTSCTTTKTATTTLGPLTPPVQQQKQQQ